MKLEGWIAISEDGINWLVAQFVGALRAQREDCKAINWQDSVRCTITIPDTAEEGHDG